SVLVGGPAATNTPAVGPRTGQHSQRRTEGPLRLLRHCRKLSFPAKGPSGGRTLLAQNAVQPELGRAHHVGHVPPDQTAATDLATKAVPSLSGVTSSRSAVNHLLKSVVREIRTLRSVGTGGGRPPPVTRWARDEIRVPTATASGATAAVSKRKAGERSVTRIPATKPMAGCTARLGKIDDRLGQRRAFFEAAAARLPQNEGIPLMPSKDYILLRKSHRSVS